MKLFNHVKLDLEEDLLDADFHLRVKFGMGSVIRCAEKTFNLSINYPKVDGDAFKAFMEEFQPDTFLVHSISTNGNR